MSKTIFITGASGALGKEVVEAAVAAGHRVFACGRKEQLSLGCVYRSVDLSEEEAAREIVSQCVQEYGSVDAAFLLAGGFSAGSFTETSSADIDQQLTLNFKTAYQVARPLFLHMRENRKGHICLIGARAALEPASGGFAVGYTLAKSMLHTLANLLESEGKPHGVRTSLLVPSIIDTPSNREMMPKVDPTQWVHPRAIAEALLLLVDEKTSSWRESVLKLYHKA